MILRDMNEKHKHFQLYQPDEIIYFAVAMSSTHWYRILNVLSCDILNMWYIDLKMERILVRTTTCMYRKYIVVILPVVKAGCVLTAALLKSQ